MPNNKTTANELANPLDYIPDEIPANTKRLVNTSLPPDTELAAGWDACMASLRRPPAQNAFKALMELGFHKPGEVEKRLGYYVSQIHR